MHSDPSRYLPNPVHIKFTISENNEQVSLGFPNFKQEKTKTSYAVKHSSSRTDCGRELDIDLSKVDDKISEERR